MASNPVLNLDVTPVNDAPTFAGILVDNTFTEDTTGNVDLSAASFADVENDTLTVTLTASAGTFGTPSDGSGVGSGVAETLVSSTVITLEGLPADITSYLDTASIPWTPPANALAIIWPPLRSARMMAMAAAWPATRS